MPKCLSHVVAALCVLVACGTGSTVAAQDATPPPNTPTSTTTHSKAFWIQASTYGVLSGLDVYTTTVALRSGKGVEVNPILAPIADHTAALIAVKAASTASTIYLARRLWKQHPKTAITVLVIANVATGVVVAHNAAVATGP